MKLKYVNTRIGEQITHFRPSPDIACDHVLSLTVHNCSPLVKVNNGVCEKLTPACFNTIIYCLLQVRYAEWNGQYIYP